MMQPVAVSLSLSCSLFLSWLDPGKWLQLAEAAPEAPQPRQGGAESLSPGLSQSLPESPSQDTSHRGIVASCGSEIYTGKLKIVNNTTSCVAIWRGRVLAITVRIAFRCRTLSLPHSSLPRATKKRSECCMWCNFKLQTQIVARLCESLSKREGNRGRENAALLGCSIKKSHLLTYKSCVHRQQRVPKQRRQ